MTKLRRPRCDCPRNVSSNWRMAGRYAAVIVAAITWTGAMALQVQANEQLPWQSQTPPQSGNYGGSPYGGSPYSNTYPSNPVSPSYGNARSYGPGDTPQTGSSGGYGTVQPGYQQPDYRSPYGGQGSGYNSGDGYSSGGAYAARPRRYDRHDQASAYEQDPGDGTFSVDEITAAGHRFFGSISQGMASVIEYAFQNAGRPNGYILGEDAGGAFIAGLRYGEGVLYTKDAGDLKVFWQGPSIGYDFGAEGSRVMVLVYNLRAPYDIYRTFGGVAGSAYLVGGVGINFQKSDDIVLAPIRAGVGLRLGANIGYLKYTPEPTWNPF